MEHRTLDQVEQGQHPGEPRGVARVLLFAAVAALCLLPGVAFSRLHVTDGFLYQFVAYVRATLSADHLRILDRGGYSFGFVEFLPGYPMILSLFARAIPIAPEQLHFMPIAALFLPLCYFALTYKLFKSFTLACLFALYGAYDIGLASHYNVFAYTWSNLLYLGFTLIALRLANGRQARDAIVLFLLFAGTLFMHYASTMWLIVFMLVFNVVLVLRRRWPQAAAAKKAAPSSLAMPFAFAIAFLAFNQVFYRVWLPSFQTVMAAGDNPMGAFAAKLGSYLGLGTKTPEPYQFLNPWGEHFGWWRIAEYLLIVLPIALWFAKMGRDLALRRPIRFKRPYYVELAAILVVTALIDGFVYGIHSGIKMRYVSLMFPFLTVISLDQLNVPGWAVKGTIGALVLAAMVLWGIGFDHYATLPPTSYGQAQASANWFLAHQIEGPVLSDLDTVGLFLVHSASDDDGFPVSAVYDAGLYGSVIDGARCEERDQGYRFVLVDTAAMDKPLHGVRNFIYEPLSRHRAGMADNRCLTRVYDDGAVAILERSR